MKTISTGPQGEAPEKTRTRGVGVTGRRGVGILEAQARNRAHSLLLLPGNPDVELLATSPAPCLPLLPCFWLFFIRVAVVMVFVHSNRTLTKTAQVMEFNVLMCMCLGTHQQDQHLLTGKPLTSRTHCPSECIHFHQVPQTCS